MLKLLAELTCLGLVVAGVAMLSVPVALVVAGAAGIAIAEVRA